MPTTIRKPPANLRLARPMLRQLRHQSHDYWDAIAIEQDMADAERAIFTFTRREATIGINIPIHQLSLVLDPRAPAADLLRMARKKYEQSGFAAAGGPIPLSDALARLRASGAAEAQRPDEIEGVNHDSGSR